MAMLIIVLGYDAKVSVVSPKHIIQLLLFVVQFTYSALWKNITKGSHKMRSLCFHQMPFTFVAFLGFAKIDGVTRSHPVNMRQ
jgi:fumarate reductase subunit D